MRTSLFFALNFLLPIVAFSQPTLTSSYNPTIGTSNSVAACDTNGIEPGPAGANKTWTFTLIPTGPIETLTYTDANGATSYDYLYPYANIAYPEYQSNIYTYLQTNSAGIWHWGYSSNAEAEYNSNSRKELRYPFTFGESFTDDYAFTQTLVSYPGSGTQTVKYDAFGKLIINGHTFNNVIRIHTWRNYTYGSSVISHTDVYRWIDPTMPGKVLLDIAIRDGYKLVKAAEITVGIEETLDKFDFTIIPNVVIDSKATIIYKSATKLKLEIFNGIGQPVKSTVLYSNDNALVELDLAGLAKGIYFANVTDGNGRRGVRRFVVM